MQKIILLFTVAFLLAACAPNPVDVAEGEAIRIQAEQAALDQEQARAHRQEIYEIEEAERRAISEQTVRAEQERLRIITETEATQAKAKQTFVRWASTTGSISLGIVLLSLALGLSWGMIGSGKAWARMAEVRANLIPLNAATRQFPLIMQYTGKGRYTLANPNTGSVAYLDTRRNEDRQLIAASGAVELAGAIAAEARKSKDPASISIIRPTVIGAKNKKLEVGADLHLATLTGDDEDDNE